jgi:hypothetical protein
MADEGAVGVPRSGWLDAFSSRDTDEGAADEKDHRSSSHDNQQRPEIAVT